MYSRKFYNEISHRAVVFWKFVDFPFFTFHHINLRELFQAQGWENFLSLRKTQYTTLVKNFYIHFHLDNHGKITSFVKGKTISVTLNTLATILRVPRVTLQCYSTNNWVQFQGYEPLDSMRQMCGNPNISKKPKGRKITNSPLEVDFFIISSPTIYFVEVAHMNTYPILTFSSYGVF